jgi:hypothetical protein
VGGEEYQWEIVMILKIIIQFEVWKHWKTILKNKLTSEKSCQIEKDKLWKSYKHFLLSQLMHTIIKS